MKRLYPKILRPCGLALALTLAAIPLSGLAQVQEPDLNWEVAVVSDYRFRSVSLSDKDPTLQGGLMWKFPSNNVYAGAWASGTDKDTFDSDIETDIFVGYQYDIDPSTHLDVRLSRYIYHGGDGDSQDWNELSTVTTLYNTWKVGLNFTPKLFGSESRAWYTSVTKDWPLPVDDLSLTTHVGRTTVQREKAPFGSFVDWHLGLTKSFDQVLPSSKLDVSLGFYGASGSGRDDFGDIADSGLVLSATLKNL